MRNRRYSPEQEAEAKEILSAYEEGETIRDEDLWRLPRVRTSTVHTVRVASYDDLEDACFGAIEDAEYHVDSDYGVIVNQSWSLAVTHVPAEWEYESNRMEYVAILTTVYDAPPTDEEY